MAGVAIALLAGVAALEVNGAAAPAATRAISTIAKSPGSRSATVRPEQPVAIVGDSRILFDTDLDRFEALTGVRPVQLAIHGTSALTLLEDAAEQ